MESKLAIVKSKPTYKGSPGKNEGLIVTFLKYFMFSNPTYPQNLA